MATRKQQVDDFISGKQLDPRDIEANVFLTQQQIDEEAVVFIQGAPLHESANVFIEGVVPQHESAKDFLG